MVTIIIGNNSIDDSAGCEDAALYSSSPDNNYGAAFQPDLSINRPWLIKFSGLLSISSPVIVSSATLSLYKHYGTGEGNNYLRRILRNWIVGTQDAADRSNDTPYSCCYNEYGEENAWSTPGCLGDGTDRIAAQSAVLVTGVDINQYYTSGDLSADVEDMINGDVPNYGWHTSNTIATYNHYFRTSENSDGSRPFLTVNFTSGGGSSVAAMQYYKNILQKAMQ